MNDNLKKILLSSFKEVRYINFVSVLLLMTLFLIPLCNFIFYLGSILFLFILFYNLYILNLKISNLKYYLNLEAQQVDNLEETSNNSEIIQNQSSNEIGQNSDDLSVKNVSNKEKEVNKLSSEFYDYKTLIENEEKNW